MEALNNFIEAVQMLIRAKDLLERVYLDIGPYRDGKLEDRTWNDVRNFFDFDDSE